MTKNEFIVATVFHVSNSSDFDSGNRSDIIDHNDVVEKFRMVFTVFGIALGMSAIAMNVAIITASIIRKNMLAPFSIQTAHLVISLAVADLLLLLFGLPYDLVAANGSFWLDGSIGCQVSAYLPEASRVAWLGTVLLAMPLRWPSTMATRMCWPPAGSALVWVLSLAAAMPFALRVECLALSATTDTEVQPETQAGSSLWPAEASCFCAFAVSQSEVGRMFGSSLLAFTLFPILAIAMLSWKGWTEAREAPSIKKTTSPRRLALMLSAFMACTLPRYVHVVVNYSEHAPAMDGHYGLILSIIEILCYSVFYSSTLIHFIVSPHPRALLGQLCQRPPQQMYIIDN